MNNGKKAYTKNKWPRKNLGELVNFLEEQHPEGLSLSALCTSLGVKKGTVSNMFRHDDMHLSRAESIARAYGYTLRLYFPVRKLEDGYLPCPPRVTYDNAGNLAGLVKYIQDSEYGVPFIAERMKVNANTIRRAFRRGDIMMSTLNLMLDTLGICMIWKFEKNEDK